MAHKIHIVGNWKMHGTPETARRLAEAVTQAKFQSQSVVVLCPPAVLIAEVAAIARAGAIKVGGQDCHAAAEGAFTGDVSAPMLKAAGCDYVIVGHSERRQQHGETSEDVRQKAAAAIAAGLIPIICIGETDSERAAGKAFEVVARQVEESIPSPLVGEGRVGGVVERSRLSPGQQLSNADSEKKSESAGKLADFILAYEPVWAIGSGKTPTADDIRAMHAEALKVAAERTGLAQNQISVLYGGSVKAANAKEILSQAGVSGVLVGGASLNAEEFCKIIGAL